MSSALFRNRFVYAGLMVMVIALGLASRRFPELWPTFWATYAGDTLWALLLFLLIGFVRPTLSTKTVGLLTLTIAFMVEISQLYRASWLDALRATTIGALVLGRGFLWSDFACYTVGTALGAVFEVDYRGYWDTFNRTLHDFEISD